MEMIADCIKDIFLLILSLTFIEILLPNSSLSKYLKFLFSVIILATILNIFK